MPNKCHYLIKPKNRKEYKLPTKWSNAQKLMNRLDRIKCVGHDCIAPVCYTKKKDGLKYCYERKLKWDRVRQLKLRGNKLKCFYYKNTFNVKNDPSRIIKNIIQNENQKRKNRRGKSEFDPKPIKRADLIKLFDSKYS